MCKMPCLQEGEELQYAEVDILLTLEQFKRVLPNTEACYLHHGTLICFETISVPVSHILDLCQAPYSLLKWEASGQKLLMVTRQVC